MIILLDRKITPEEFKPSIGQLTYEIADSDIRNKLEELTKKYLEL